MNGLPYLTNLVREVQLIEQKTRREAEREAALAADSKEYNISPESKAALARGDRQREMGAYQTEQVEHCYATIAGDDFYFNHICSLDKGHAGDHQCAGIGWCNRTWE